MESENGIEDDSTCDTYQNGVEEEEQEPLQEMVLDLIDEDAVEGNGYKVDSEDQFPFADEGEEDEFEAEEERKLLSPFVAPNQRPDAPLCGILADEYQHIDPRLYISDFRFDGPLRFSRVFGVNPRTLAKNLIWWPSKTFKKKDSVASDEPVLSPKKADCVVDQTQLFLDPDLESKLAIKQKANEEEDEAPSWRFGPAQMWYDQMGIPEKPKKFDYGFKYQKGNKKPKAMFDLPEDSLLPVNFTRWEDDIIMDISEKAPSDFRVEQVPKYGWVNTVNTRTLKLYRSCWSDDSSTRTLDELQQRVKNDIDDCYGPDGSRSIFPLVNEEVESIPWENDIIIDPDNMTSVLEPKTLTLMYEEDPIVYGTPEDVPSDDRKEDRHYDKRDQQFTKKSKMILGQVQRRQKQEEEEQLESTIAQIADKDPFNMSNDDYYAPKTTQRNMNGTNIQHSIPAQNIHRAFFPTNLNSFKLRHLHRMPLMKKVMRDMLSQNLPIHNLVKHIKKADEQRRRQKIAECGGDIFYMRTLADLSGRDGRLIMVEYSEEHPPLLSQPGMASRIRNYYKRKAQKDVEPEMEFGESAFAMNAQFLGNLAPGQCLQAIENNMYRAPIYQHKPLHTDFLLVRNKNGIYIRECPTLFVAGQECPSFEVPSPNSKKASVFVRDFLLAFIYRLFWASDQQPRRLKMDDIKNAFPHYAESSVRKRLKQCSDFKRLGAGTEQNYWVVREDFRLPSKEEVLSMVTPEMCCAQYSMMSAEQRLKDAGYGEKYFFTPENDDDSDDQVTIEDEIKCAPWNTSRAFISATKGKCLLDQSGVADPTGCGQGFSYVRVSAKPQKEDVPQIPKRLVTGTNADLRKLPLKEAKEICRSYGVKEEEINSLTRWEVIDVIRTLSTQAAKARSDFSGAGMARFARGNIRFNFADMQDKYKKYCQNVFDLQNQALSCEDIVSTDEGSDNEDSDNEDMASRLEKILDGNEKNALSKTIRQKVEMEDEERERLALQKMIKGSTNKAPEKSIQKEAELAQNQATVPRKLKIYRTVKSSEGVESTRVEVINNPHVIDAYLGVRHNRDLAWIKVYAEMDEQYKEERRKEKRRLQDQLRRIRRNEMRQKMHTQIGRPPKKKPEKEKKVVPIKPSLQKMRCSACGGNGHMKTNKNCPLYGKDTKAEKTVGDLLNTTNPNVDLDGLSLASGELFELEGTRLKVSTKFFKHAEQQDKMPLKLRIPKHLTQGQMTNSPEETKQQELVEDDQLPGPSNRFDLPSPASTVVSQSNRKNRRKINLDDTEYLMGPMKSVHRRRADPRVSLSTLLLEIFNEIKSIEGVDPLMQPVNPKLVKDYYDIIANPIDLQKIRKNINDNKYELRRQFMTDLVLMLDNAKKYNGPAHPITVAANKVFELACRRIADHEQRLIELEKAINPLLDDNDMVGFSYILGDIVQSCKNLPKSAAFHVKVDTKKLPHYLDKINRPMDLGTIEQQVKDKFYKNIDTFLADIKQIYDNSATFNGPESPYTLKAKDIYDHAKVLVMEKEVQLKELEARIAKTEANEQQANFISDVEDDMTRDSLPTMEDTTMFPDEESMDAWSNMDLSTSKMQQEGQLNADLELSDTDSEDEGGSLAKRMRVDDDLDTL
ncbi:unnamed protein product [Bursaphelenchus okinawaensis]|uniref:Bromo domain-containing protein n=1 Tax=Bursaphelenchus okinawaensis TaxID=465554 RepID=A0A811JTA1_9BILA|nr:unnamed protein product [Bursaphelenchus okinawaensis]CAG9082035.1 unnamed protein product [Bursaphelenchus okinawaensis]